MHPLIPWFESPAVSFPFPFVGSLTIHGFGVLVAMGFYFGSWVAQRKAERFGGSADAINRLVGWLVVGTFIGGHWGDLLFYHPEDIVKDPMSLLRFWQGLSSFGGFLVCVPITVWFFWREKKPFWPHADALAIALTLGWFFGRVGCFSAHDHAGEQTEFWLGVYGMCPGHNPTVACHDMGLYEAIWSFGMFVVFTILDRKPRPPGFYCGWLAISYGPCRLVSDFYRNASVDTRYFGMTPAQYCSILLIGVGVAVLLTMRGRVDRLKT